MAEIREYIKQNLSLSFASWSQGQKVGSLIGLLIAGAIGVVGWAGIALIQPAVQHYWPFALTIFFLALVLVVTPFRMWRGERDRADEAATKLKPKLKCSFSPNGSGCVRPNTVLHGQGLIKKPNGKFAIRELKERGVYYRLSVEALGSAAVPGCTGYITSIKRNGKAWVDGENLLLTFAPAEQPDSTQKEIRPGITAYLDFLFISDQNRPMVTTKDFKGPSSVNFDDMFATAAEYVFHIIVSSPGSTSVASDIRFKWTGNRDTTELSAISTP